MLEDPLSEVGEADSDIFPNLNRRKIPAPGQAVNISRRNTQQVCRFGDGEEMVFHQGGLRWTVHRGCCQEPDPQECL